MISKGEAVDDMSIDYEQCGKRTHMFWQDPAGKFIEYLRLSRPFDDKIYVTPHNSRGYDAQFLLQRFLELRWVPQFIMDGTKTLSVFVCGKRPLSGFPKLVTHEPKQHAQII